MRLRRRNLRKGLVLVGCVVAVPSWPAWAIGLLALTLGSALHVWTKGVLEQNRRLVTAGPYRWTRNPFYLANGLIDLGLCLVIGRLWLAIVYLVIWAIAYHGTIAREEAHLRQLFGQALDRYRARVPKLRPALRPLPRAEAHGAFSWANPNLAEGREYARIGGMWLAAGAIAAAAVARRQGLDLLEPEQRGELGLILLLAAGWILKLALAQAFRHPESSLLPDRLSRRRRRGIGIGALAPALAAIGLERGWIGIAMVSGLVVTGVLAWVPMPLEVSTTDNEDPAQQSGPVQRAGLVQRTGPAQQAGPGRLAAVLPATVAFASLLAWGAFWDLLWLAIPSVLWLGLAILDDLGGLRLAREGRSKQGTWPYLPRVAGMAGAVGLTLGLLLVATR